VIGILIVDIVFLAMAIYAIERGQHSLTDSVIIKPKKLIIAVWAMRVSGILTFVMWILHDLGLGLTFNGMIALSSIMIMALVLSTLYLIYLVIKIKKEQLGTIEPVLAPETK
jgi:hypothetical protein